MRRLDLRRRVTSSKRSFLLFMSTRIKVPLSLLSLLFHPSLASHCPVFSFYLQSPLPTVQSFLHLFLFRPSTGIPSRLLPSVRDFPSFHLTRNACIRVDQEFSSKELNFVYFAMKETSRDGTDASDVMRDGKMECLQEA